MNSKKREFQKRRAFDFSVNYFDKQPDVCAEDNKGLLTLFKN